MIHPMKVWGAATGGAAVGAAVGGVSGRTISTIATGGATVAAGGATVDAGRAPATLQVSLRQIQLGIEYTFANHKSTSYIRILQ